MTRRSLAAALAMLATACAIDTPPAPPPGNDPQAAYEPPSQPGAGQEFLARMVGDWRVVKTFHSRSGAPAVSEGTCHQAMVHGGRFLESDFEFHRQGGTATGTGIIGFDPGSGVFTSFWIDSRSTRVSTRQSRGTFDGERIVLYGLALGAEARPVSSRTETTIGADSRSVSHRQFAVSTDGTERLVMELQMTRRG